MFGFGVVNIPWSCSPNVAGASAFAVYMLAPSPSISIAIVMYATNFFISVVLVYEESWIDCVKNDR